MKSHNDRGRLLIADAISKSELASQNLRNVALDCILAYENNKMKTPKEFEVSLDRAMAPVDRVKQSIILNIKLCMDSLGPAGVADAFGRAASDGIRVEFPCASEHGAGTALVTGVTEDGPTLDVLPRTSLPRVPWEDVPPYHLVQVYQILHDEAVRRVK